MATRIQEIFRPVQNGDISCFPTLAQDHAYSGVSNRYSFIPTTAPLKVLAELGWQPVAVAEKRTRKLEKAGFQAHAVRLRNLSENRALSVGQTIPELVLVNAHEGSASFKLLLALFELVCSNGLMVESERFAEAGVRHVGYTGEKIAQALASIVPNVPTILADVERFKQIKLAPEETKAFAQAAIELRWDGEKYAVNPSAVSYPRHREQKEDNLYFVMNRVQESIIRGGPLVKNLETGNLQKARAVSGLSENIRLNKALWRLTSEMAQLKTA